MQQLRQFATSLPVQVITMILLVFWAGDYIPLGVKEFFFTISALIKDLLILALPYVIFAYLFSTLIALQNGAILFVVSLVLSVICMNFMGLNIAYFVSQFLTQVSGLSPVTTDPSLELSYLWRLPVPDVLAAILKNEHGLILGVLSGIGLGYLNIKGLSEISDRLKAGASFFLNKMFIPVVPLFILGFILKMQHEGTLTYVIKQYGPIYLMIAAVQITYLSLLFFIGAKFSTARWITYLRNMVPPAIAGITTMSSAAALPFSFKAAEANTQDPLIARSVIPSTVNINLMGDSLGVPLMILATMVTFGIGIPSYDLYLIFALQYVMYMFTVAAVPGGTIIVMIPLIKGVFGFNGEMISLVTALYILYDAIGTTMNIIGNGAFVILYNRLFGGLVSKKKALA